MIRWHFWQAEMEKSRHSRLGRIWPQSIVLLAVVLGGCNRTDQQAPAGQPRINEKTLVQLQPVHSQNRKLWAADLLAIMDELNIRRTASNACSIIAVIDQESNFKADPPVDNLGRTARNELLERVRDKLGKLAAQKMENMLAAHPTPQASFEKRLLAVKTEQQLDMLYREMYQYFKSQYKLGLATGVASLVAGQSLEEYLNPVKTLGSMQVHIDYVLANPRTYRPANQLRNEVYSRFGGMYYGTHRLMLYHADYDKPIYRFADYNSGMYSSRNAALQKAVSRLLGSKLTLDGDLLIYDRDNAPTAQVSSSEAAISKLLTTGNQPLTPAQVRADLRREKTAEFEETATYREIKARYFRKFNQTAPYAIMPQVKITGPKISRDLNTNWYATRVEKRYQTCLSAARRLGLSTRT